MNEHIHFGAFMLAITQVSFWKVNIPSKIEAF